MTKCHWRCPTCGHTCPAEARADSLYCVDHPPGARLKKVRRKKKVAKKRARSATKASAKRRVKKKARRGGRF